MVEVINTWAGSLIVAYNDFISMLPGWIQIFINLFLLVLLIVVYSVFVWKFYTFISKKNILSLNLNQYNKTEHAFWSKIITITFYFVEYLLILPVLVFFWFAVFTLFMIFLVEEVIKVHTILLISATVIASIRMAAYYKKPLAEDIAKLFPFMLLATTVLSPLFFQEDLFVKIAERLFELPTFFGEIIIYLGFIIILEAILRFFYFLFSLFGLEEENTKDDEED